MAGFWDALRDLPLRIFAPNVTYVGARSDAINELVLGGVGHMTVATMWRTPRCANTAANTPVPVPMSNASSFEGSGALAIRSMYSPRTGENTP